MVVILLGKKCTHNLIVQFAKHSPHWFLGWALAGSWRWGRWGERKWPRPLQEYSQCQLPVEMTSPRPLPACPQHRAQVWFCTGPLTLRSQQERDMPHPRTGEPPMLRMESRWRFPYGGACAPGRRQSSLAPRPAPPQTQMPASAQPSTSSQGLGFSLLPAPPSLRPPPTEWPPQSF